MKAQFFFFAVLASTVFTSCDKRLHKEGSGVIQTTTRSLNNFSSLEADGKFNIYTYHSSEPHVVITTDDNIMDEVQTFVQDGKLMVQMSEDYLNYDATKLEIKIYTDGYTNIQLDGRSDLHVMDTISSPALHMEHDGRGYVDVLFNGEELTMKIDGLSDMSAGGIANQVNYSVNGDGKISALQLFCTNADADINGSGKIYVNCSEHLDASIDGNGDIYYIGSPTLTTSINGSGSVQPY